MLTSFAFSEICKVLLVKKLEYKRTDCTCGVAIIPTDPTPDISSKIRSAAVESGAGFKILDVTEHPEVMKKYGIKELPAVVIGDRAYPAEAGIVSKIIEEMKK